MSSQCPSCHVSSMRITLLSANYMFMQHNSYSKTETIDKLLKRQCSAAVIYCLFCVFFCECVCVCVPEWEIDKGVQFIPHIATVGEAFQMNHQHWRQRPQIQLLGGLLVLLTVRTVPARQHAHFMLAACVSPPVCCMFVSTVFLTMGPLLPVFPLW